MEDQNWTEIYYREFPAGTEYDVISDRLESMEKSKADALRMEFCDDVLLVLTADYVAYENTEFLALPLFELFCRNADILPESGSYFKAVSSFFQHENKKALKLMGNYLKKHFTADSSEIIGEQFICDYFFEPFKNAVPGFWESIARLTESYPHSSGAVELCRIIGDYYNRTTREEELDVLLRGLQLWPDSVLLQELAGCSYYNMGMWQNSLARFESVEGHQIFFHDDILYFMEAWCCGKVKDKSREIFYYRQSLEINPNDLDTMNNLAYCLYRQRHLTEAKEILEKCISLDSDYRLAANNYVRVLIALHRYKDAKSFVHKGYPVSADLKRKVKAFPSTNERYHKESSELEKITEAEDLHSMQGINGSPSERYSQFSNEKLLEDELTARMEAGMEVFGKKLRVYRRKGEYGRQFVIPIGRLDLLCEDDAGDLYVVELKKDSGYDDAYAQICQYLEWFSHSSYAEGKNIYGIICLNAPSEELLFKVHQDPRVKLFEYQISYAER